LDLPALQQEKSVAKASGHPIKPMYGHLTIKF